MAVALAEAAERAKTWMLGAMLPLWTGAGFDGASGQFVEAITLDGEPVEAPRRALVQARQMSVCCTGGRLGWNGPWAERASAAGEALLARGRGAHGDWIYSFDGRGQPADSRSDLYTQAFLLFGFADAGRALGRADFIDAARATRDRLERHWADPGGGYREGDIAPHPGRQNPHMHLLEAALTLYAATGEADDLAWAERLGALFEARVLTGPGFVPEAFDPGWRPVPGEGASPGHQFEWGYLLDRLGRAGGRDRSAISARLITFGEAHGVDADGFAIDAIEFDGRPKARSARLWQQAERLRTALSRPDGAIGAGAGAAAAQASAALMAYFATPTPGLWRDQRRAGGGWEAGPAPASSGYHIAGALEALIAAAPA
ncbi:MAG TPA: AGE family epimerase/isomerase [Caulobacteraceae bacterium]|jgi:mannose-6-phosphate isomerase|nr:AGE family epimerase/isomerase [Caulobacteraceae bacterium]